MYLEESFVRFKLLIAELRNRIQISLSISSFCLHFSCVDNWLRFS